MTKGPESLAENGPPLPDRSVRTVRVPIRIADGAVVLAWGTALPEMRDCSGDLIVPASAIRNAADLAILSADDWIPFLPAGATVLCKLGARHIPAGLLKLCQFALLPEAPHQRAAFVEIVLEKDLELRLRGTKPALLGDVPCKIPAMSGREAYSLNEAYRRISEKFEPTRRSAGGNVFLNVYYKTPETSSLVSLNSLRDRRTGVWDAYLRTTFTADTPGGPIEIRPGSSNAALDAILRTHRVSEWAYVTAHNPGSLVTPESTNKLAHEKLCAHVHQQGWVSFEGNGVGPDGGWPPEVSLLILGLSSSEARVLGKKFGQFAVVGGRVGGPARLQAC
jgi:uncharacterized protein DUF3293